LISRPLNSTPIPCRCAYHRCRCAADQEPRRWRGRKFTSPDKHAEITISGFFANVDTDDELASRLEAGEGETIKFKKRQGKWVIVSGTKGDRIFYRKTLLSCGDSIGNNLWVEYPAAEKEKYDALVTHVAVSLRPGRGYGMTTKCR
jgi:serine/threonine-protein kinase